MADGPSSPGERLYLVRLACGDGLRKAESMTEFVLRVARRTGEKYHPNAVSLLERNQQQWRLEDVRVFAAVDPLNRGEIWLSALSEAASWPEVEIKTYDPKPQELAGVAEADTRPDYLRVAEKHGGEVAKGSPERPTTAKPAAKRAAGSGRKPKR